MDWGEHDSDVEILKNPKEMQRNIERSITRVMKVYFYQPATNVPVARENSINLQWSNNRRSDFSISNIPCGNVAWNFIIPIKIN